MGAFREAELDDFLNRTLEAERAGAEALVVFMDDWPHHGPEWRTLRKVHEDEAHNCTLIGEQLKRRGRDYSHATGELYGKAIAVRSGLYGGERGIRTPGTRWVQQISSLPHSTTLPSLRGRNERWILSVARDSLGAAHVAP